MSYFLSHLMLASVIFCVPVRGAEAPLCLLRSVHDYRRRENDTNTLIPILPPTLHTVTMRVLYKCGMSTLIPS